MPIMNGYDATREIRAMERERSSSSGDWSAPPCRRVSSMVSTTISGLISDMSMQHTDNSMSVHQLFTHSLTHT